MARPLEGLIRQDSIHAAGVVISKGPLTDHLPLMQKGDAEVVTQVSMTDVEKLGLLKMDFLGLRNLDVIDSAVKIIRAGGQPDFDIETIPLDDAETYRMLAKGDSEGVFQFESSGMREALRDIQPTLFDDLIALVALYRPGPMDYIPVYARNKRDPSQIRFDDPRLEPIVGPTYGVAIYQEQLMEISKVIGGFTPAQADDLRKAIGKKIKEKMDALEPKFRAGAAANGTAPRVIDSPVVAHAEGRRLLVQQVARGLLRAHLLPHRLSQGQVPGAVHGGSHLQRHGHQGQGARSTSTWPTRWASRCCRPTSTSRCSTSAAWKGASASG